MSYNYDKNTCDLCGSKKENDKKGFILSWNGGVLCSVCEKEQALTELFNLIDEKEKLEIK